MTTYVHGAVPAAVAREPRPVGRFLEIGPRPGRLGEDWTTVGVEECGYVDRVALWGHHRLPFDDGTFEGFYAAHVIEHVPWWNTVPALAEAFRVLRPGGWIEIHTIDFGVLVREAYLAKRRPDTWTCGGMNGGHWMRWIASRLICWDRTYAGVNWHRAMFDEEYLAWCLSEAGFVSAARCGPPRGPEKHGIVNLGMRAARP